MKIAVISDIHGNLEALEKVLQDAGRSGADKIICLGDCIGYGPDSNRVVEKIMAGNIPAVTGNHELVLHNRIHLNWFNSLARISLEKIIPTLSAEVKNFLRGLPHSLTVNDARFVHGCPLQSIKTYLFLASDYRIRRALDKMKEKICFVGHTHDLVLISYDGRNVLRSPLRAEQTPVEGGRSYIVNVGSVGQPRDGTNTAKYVIWDTERKRIVLRRIEYDIARVVEKIKAAGLPEVHGRRLW